MLGIYIAVGAVIGALLRWQLALTMNAIFPTSPLGTLLVNILGGFLIGIFMGVTKDQIYISEPVRLMIVTGFLGSLTTFSTFSAETLNLIMHEQYFWSGVMVSGHVLGSLAATFIGMYFVRFFGFVWS